MPLIELTVFSFYRYGNSPHGSSIYVNPAHIVSISLDEDYVVRSEADLKLPNRMRPLESCTIINCLGNGEASRTFRVCESPRQVIALCEEKEAKR